MEPIQGGKKEGEREVKTNGKALTVAKKNAEYQRNFYHRLRQEAEIGRSSGAALATIREHMSILAANLEASARTARMVQKLISDLESKD